jgi:hypothetical protein
VAAFQRQQEATRKRASQLVSNAPNSDIQKGQDAAHGCSGALNAEEQAAGDVACQSVYAHGQQLLFTV